jgi:4'-phosphopantetheinyl transferase
MTLLYYLFFDRCLPDTVFNDRLQLLPVDQAEKIRCFHRWQDAHASLFGKLLLLKGFKHFDLSINLADMKYSGYGKPYIEKTPVSFNISHSGNCVVCALSTDTKSIGIDVEEIKAIDITDFKNNWTDNEWKEISNNDAGSFYRFWTCKEAIIKAEGRGLSIPLNNIEVWRTYGLLLDKTYFLTEFNLHPDFVATMASPDRITTITTIAVQHTEMIQA